MSRVADIDGWRLTMPAGGWLWKYDDSSFHRNQFQNFAGGSKAMDAVALEANGTLWLIELKDYRRHRRIKPSSIFNEVAGKVRATLAGLITAKVRANDATERTLAQQAFGSSQIRVALQVAQAVPPSRLFPQVVDPQDAALALKRAVRAVDAHPICAVGNMSHASVPWTTSAIQHTGV